MNEYAGDAIAIGIVVSFIIAYLSIKFDWKMGAWF